MLLLLLLFNYYGSKDQRRLVVCQISPSLLMAGSGLRTSFPVCLMRGLTLSFHHHKVYNANYAWLRLVLKSFLFPQHIPAGRTNMAMTGIITFDICRIFQTFQSPFAYVTSCGIKHLPWVLHSWIIRIGVLCQLLDLTSSCFPGRPTNRFTQCQMHSLPPVFRELRSTEIWSLVCRRKVAFTGICFVEVGEGVLAEKRTGM